MPGAKFFDEVQRLNIMHFTARDAHFVIDFPVMEYACSRMMGHEGMLLRSWCAAHVMADDLPLWCTRNGETDET